MTYWRLNRMSISSAIVSKRTPSTEYTTITTNITTKEDNVCNININKSL